MIDILLIVIVVMFGTLFYDKNKRPLASGIGRRHTHQSPFRQTPRAFDARNGFGGIKENFYQSQPIDYDNNIASIYGYKSNGYDTTPKSTILTCTKNDGLMGMNRWCGCEALSTQSPNAQLALAETATARLIGGVNPKTLIKPTIAPPITDVEEWGTDNYTIHSAINNFRSDELFLSGYATVDNCKCSGSCNCSKRWNKPLIKETFNEDCEELGNSEDCGGCPQILQNYGISNTQAHLGAWQHSRPSGGNGTQAHLGAWQHSRPSGGITNGDELIIIIENQKKRARSKLSHITGDEPSMIYDPRMNGHSDSARAYVDKLLGQPKFYYDDINTARAPNYVTRNKIDIYSFGETTGRLADPRTLEGRDNNQLAVEEFHNSALLHRADIMHSLMSKRNGEMQQLRNFPISTNGQRMVGGTSKI